MRKQGSWLKTNQIRIRRVAKNSNFCFTLLSPFHWPALANLNVTPSYK